jgi:hypothetical protein
MYQKFVKTLVNGAKHIFVPSLHKRLSLTRRICLYLFLISIGLGSIYAILCYSARRQLASYELIQETQHPNKDFKKSLTFFSKEATEAGNKLIQAILPPKKNTDISLSNIQIIQSNSHVFCYSKLPGELAFNQPPNWLYTTTLTPGRPATAPNNWQQFIEETKRNTKEIDAIIAALKSPEIGLPEMYLSESNKMKIELRLSLASELCHRMFLAQLHLGNMQKAHEHMIAMIQLLQLRKKNQTTRWESSPIVARTVFFAGVDYLQYSDWNDSELSEMQYMWQGVDFYKNAEMSIRLGQAAIPDEIESVRHNWPMRCMCDFMDDFDSPGKAFMRIVEDGEYSMLYYRFPCYWDWILRQSYNDQRRSLAEHNLWLDTLSSIQQGTSAIQSITKANMEFDAIKYSYKTQDHNFFQGWDMISNFKHAIETAVAAEAMKRMMIISIALKRFQLQTGAYPDNLSELSPRFLAEIPLNPASAKPFKYQLDAMDGYKLYSAGIDESNNGEKTVPNPFNVVSSSVNQSPFQDSEACWNWPHPATQEEVEREIANKRKAQIDVTTFVRRRHRYEQEPTVP